MAGVPLTTRDFEIRDFQPADFDSLWSIDRDCFPPGISYSRMELRSYIRRRGSFTLVAVSTVPETIPDSDLRHEDKSSSNVAKTNSSVAGFIVTHVGGGEGHVITIDVVAPARRFGVGSLLLRGAEDRLRSAGCRSVELETAVDNVSALSFYKRHGYTVIGTFPRYYSNGVDALILHKALLPK
jgi:ribosomal-protein-alanine N-acetyltransferase